MADNRNTAISNIQALNVPTVTNDILNTILAELWGNTQFLADVAVPQVTTTANTVLNFANKDRIELDMTGIAGAGVNLTFNGVSDGQTVYALITKTNTKTITIVGAVDITPNPAYVTIATTVLYRVTRKGTLYIAEALVKTVNPASTSAAGIVEKATDSEIGSETDTNSDGDSLYVSPSQLKNIVGNSINTTITSALKYKDVRFTFPSIVTGRFTGFIPIITLVRDQGQDMNYWILNESSVAGTVTVDVRVWIPNISIDVSVLIYCNILLITSGWSKGSVSELPPV